MDPANYCEPRFMYPSDKEVNPAIEEEPMFPALDIDLLIELVKERPELWNKDKDGKPFKRRIRATAWREVCCLLNKDFESIYEEHRQLYVSTVKSKWVHTRDAFQKSLKKRRGTKREDPPEGYTGRYEQLKFLKQYYDRQDIVSRTLARGSRSRVVDTDAETVVNVNVKRGLPKKQQKEYRKALLKSRKIRSKLNQQIQKFKPYQHFKLKTSQSAMNNVRHKVKREDDDDSNGIQYVKDNMKIDNEQAWTTPVALSSIKSEDLITIDEDSLPTCPVQGENDDYKILISEDEVDSANVDNMKDSISIPKIQEHEQTSSSSISIRKIIKKDQSPSSPCSDGNAVEIPTPKSSDNKCSSLESNTYDDDQRNAWFDSAKLQCKSLKDDQFLEFQSEFYTLLRRIQYPNKK